MFEENELSLIIDVYNAHLLTPELAGQTIRSECEDGIKLNRLDEKWKISDVENFLLRIAKLSHFEAACLEIWANAFWYNKLRDKDLDKYISKLSS